MTLSELIVATNLKKEVPIPNILKNFEIENSNEICRCKQAKYLKSIEFKDDLILILSSLVESSTPLKDFMLKFVIKRDGKLHLAAFDWFEESL